LTHFFRISSFKIKNIIQGINFLKSKIQVVFNYQLIQSIITRWSSQPKSQTSFKQMKKIKIKSKHGNIKTHDSKHDIIKQMNKVSSSKRG